MHPTWTAHGPDAAPAHFGGKTGVLFISKADDTLYEKLADICCDTFLMLHSTQDFASSGPKAPKADASPVLCQIGEVAKTKSLTQGEMTCQT